MGLDQFAFAHKSEPRIFKALMRYEEKEGEPVPDELVEWVVSPPKAGYVWRKHSRLQQFMEELYVRRDAGESLNGDYLELTKGDIQVLEAVVKTGRLPFCPGGFFWGHQFQEETTKEYKAYDLEFCKWALNQIKEGKHVYYSCWW